MLRLLTAESVVILFSSNSCFLPFSGLIPCRVWALRRVIAGPRWLSLPLRGEVLWVRLGKFGFNGPNAGPRPLSKPTFKVEGVTKSMFLLLIVLFSLGSTKWSARELLIWTVPLGSSKRRRVRDSLWLKGTLKSFAESIVPLCAPTCPSLQQFPSIAPFSGSRISGLTAFIASELLHFLRLVVVPSVELTTSCWLPSLTQSFCLECFDRSVQCIPLPDGLAPVKELPVIKPVFDLWMWGKFGTILLEFTLSVSSLEDSLDDSLDEEPNPR